MHDNDKKMKKYMGAIKRQLNMPAEIKARVMSDFSSSVEARRETGRSDEEIIAELGTPAKAAAELNEQMKEFTYRKSPWRWVWLALAVISGITMLFDGSIGLFTYLLNKSINSSVGIIGGADGPTAIFIATSPDAGLYQTGICLLLLVIGLLGYFVLKHCKQK